MIRSRSPFRLALPALFLSLSSLEAAGALRPGDPAPELRVEKWLRGGPTAPKLAEGTVYVVDFWTAWCLPCVANYPRLTALQKKHAQSGLRVIGVSWPDPVNTLEKAEAVVKEQGDRMGYDVAWDGKSETHRAWMQAARQRGIPACFVVDRKARIAWIGHPALLDLVLPDVLDGTWDPRKGPQKILRLQQRLQRVAATGRQDPEKALAELAELEQETSGVFAEQVARARFELLLRTGKFGDAWKIGEKLTSVAIEAKDAQQLNTVAWTIVDPEQPWSERDLDLAMRAARAAVDITDQKNAAILDTLARVWYFRGEMGKALETQMRAAALARGPEKASIEATLSEYEKGTF